MDQTGPSHGTSGTSGTSGCGPARRRPWPLVPLLTSVLVACAGGEAPGVAAGPTLFGSHAPAVEAELRTRGAFPGEDDVVVDAVLLTPLADTGDRFRTVRRDTIEGGERVLSWLERLRILHPAEAPFVFTTRRVYLCETAALQYGTYPARVERRGRTTVEEQPFAARWLRASDGGWRLETLWLSPTPLEVRIGTLGTGCQRAR